MQHSQQLGDVVVHETSDTIKIAVKIVTEKAHFLNMHPKYVKGVIPAGMSVEF